jgi:hypothetical protein
MVVSDISRRPGKLLRRPTRPDELGMPPWLPPFIAPLTFLSACRLVLSFLSYVVNAFPARGDRDVDYM